MTTNFTIVADQRGDKLPCEILDQPCVGCASSYADRVHRLALAVDASKPGDVISMCEPCAAEYLAGRRKLRFDVWAKAAILLVLPVVTFFVTVHIVGVLIRG